MWLFFLGMAVFTFYACTHMVAAGDTWVAMACGRHHLDHGVDTVEPFSANSHSSGPTQEEIEQWPGFFRSLAKSVGIETVRKIHPTGWVNQNWGTHVTFYSLARKFGSDGDLNYDMLIVWKFVVNFLAAGVIYLLARVIGVRGPLSAVAAAVALVIGRSFLDVRPAVYSNLLVPCVLLVLCLTVYKNRHFIWLMLPVAVFWGNVHGGYIYIFIMMVPFIGMHFLTAIPRKWSLILYNTVGLVFFVFACKKINASAVGAADPSAAIGKMLGLFVVMVVVDLLLAFGRKRLVKVDFPAVIEMGLAYIAALTAVVAFNPYYITNLTHTWVISVSENAESWRQVNEWHGAFEWSNPVGNEMPFLYFFIAIWLIGIAWAILLFLRPRQVADRVEKKSDTPNQQGTSAPGRAYYLWPKIDIPLLLTVGLTIYMAVQSRRFIPIAAAAGCPLAAMLIQQVYSMISAKWNLHKFDESFVSPIPKQVRLGVIGAVAIFVAVFGIYFGLKFKRIYLDPWVNDGRRDSVFNRMTASHLKPYDIGEFLRANSINGRMFNYWTEGGALAFFQQPDEETGEVPLKLFMDGRAQAAYDHSDFVRWNLVFSGGMPGVRALQRRQPQTKELLQEVGEWLDTFFSQEDVWVVIMPANQLDSLFMRALVRQTNWRPGYIDNEQVMYVDIESEKGKAFYRRLLTEELAFPTEFSRDITYARQYLSIAGDENHRKGLAFAKAAFERYPSRASAVEIVNAAQRPEIRDEAIAIMQGYLQKFQAEKKQIVTKSGFGNDYAAAQIFAQILSQYLKGSDAREYASIHKELIGEHKKYAKAAVW